ncbi:MAG TPA: DegT/DnrJ/EryC1/StrS family aminotransferase [Candidatus Binatia bacterium]|nr:DegT/DnrJ/EryC1/StrS family aminotransferase [Candidatus Binatia bacterium]
MPVNPARNPAPSPPDARHEAIPLLDLKRQYEGIRHEIAAALERVLASQHFTGGPEVEAFERESAQYLDVACCVGCASGTDALWLALRACGVEQNTSVVTTPFSFFSTVSSIVRCGATPILADVDPATLNLDPHRTEAAVKRGRSQNIRAILPVHLYGQCADMNRFGQLASGHGLPIVEDAAQAFGSAWGGRKAGTLGKIAAFSFYPTKNLSAYGDAGCVTTDDEDLAAYVRRLRNHGSERRYYHREIGWNSRLDAMQAAVLRVKLKHIDEWNEQRRTLACRYHGLLAGAGLIHAGATTVTREAPIVLLSASADAHHIYHQFVIRALRRDELRIFLAERGIVTEIYYPVPLHLQECFAYLGYRAGDLPESERAAREVLALPMFPELREDEQQRVVGAISDFYSRQ